MTPVLWAVLSAQAAFAQRSVRLPATPIAGASVPAAMVSGAPTLPTAGPSAPIVRLALPVMRWLAPKSLIAFFDGAAPAAEPTWYLPDGRRQSARDSERDVVELSRPWRTTAQLSRLENAAAQRAPGPVRFQVIGDAEPGRYFFSRVLFGRPGIFERQVAAAQSRGGDFVLQLGDMVSRGLAENFRALFHMLGRVGADVPFLTALGNHDRHKPHGVTNSRLYQTLLGPPSYWFDVAGKARVVVLDSSAGRVKARQLAWLDAALDTALPKIVITHMPPVQLTAWTRGVAGFKGGALEFADIVAKRGVSRVYVGHIHGLDTLQHRGVTYVLTGGGGSPLFPLTVKRRFYHTLEVEVDGESARETVHPLEGDPFPL